MEARANMEPAPHGAAVGRNPSLRAFREQEREALFGEGEGGAAGGGACAGRSRLPDLEKETEALAEDGERGTVPVGVEEGGAYRRGMLWAERPEREVHLGKFMIVVDMF
ncbi:unnamed protein product [Miscanthus lutarioriparius]|uniref:Uncharacterized protein n=1 Tax=Miscanthus lutarioriparius TaxID=422564 RepID=A0A811RFD0_9POAL|nr:unnamed protein product [Miscanthus lutarioriparius]